VHFGEDLKERAHQPQAAGNRALRGGQNPSQGSRQIIVAPPADARNTQTNHPNTPPAVLTPPEWGVVLPFRWVEIEGWPGELRPEHIVPAGGLCQTWDDNAASFECSDEMLNRIWELCRYSIKATTFAGVYVDGDRERIPYEADAYLNQLSHYYTDHDIQMARDTFDWLMKHPTWPTEWALSHDLHGACRLPHTGDTKWLASRYESLKPKLLLERARADGLLSATKSRSKRKTSWTGRWGARRLCFQTGQHRGQRLPHPLAEMMAEMAEALGKGTRGRRIQAMASKARAAFQKKPVRSGQGCLPRRRGHGSHVTTRQPVSRWPSGLVPTSTSRPWRPVGKRGMACSVYAAQYLMEGLFANGASTRALELITAPTDRSWRHMVEKTTSGPASGIGSPPGCRWARMSGEPARSARVRATFEDPVMRAGGEIHFLHRVFEVAGGLRVDLAVHFHLPRAHRGVGGVR
jgi:alpha-L-rhamnosidase